MNAWFLLALSAVNAVNGGNIQDAAKFPHIMVPGLFEAALSWREPEIVTDARTGEKRTVRGLSLTGTVVLREHLDRERSVFRINGIDMSDYVFGRRRERDSGTLRDILFEIPEGRARIELRIYALGVKGAVHAVKADFDLPGAEVLGADDKDKPVLKKRSFKAEDIPRQLMDVAPPRYRKNRQ